MTYKSLKNAIKQAIKQNGNQEITGQLLQSTLINIVETIGSSNIAFKGVINPDSTPEISEIPIFYINEISRNTQTFSNFGGLKTEKNELAIFMKDNGKAWTKLHIGHMHVQPEVTTSDIAAAAVVSTKIANGAVTSAKIDDLAVDETKIKDESITLNKLSRTVRSNVSNVPYVDKRSSSINFNIGYFECNTKANNASKVIYNNIDSSTLWPILTSPELRIGGTMRIKMKYATSIENTKLSICDYETDTEMFSLLIYYKGEIAGPGNTWANDEVIEGYWDKHFSIFYAKPWYKQIETSDIAAGAVASTHLATGAVTSSKIAYAAVETKNIKDRSVTKIKLNEELATKIDESLSFKGIASNDANKALTSGIYPSVTANIPITGETFTIQTLRTTTYVYNQYVSTQIAIGTTGTAIGKVYIRKNIQKSGAYTFGDWISLTADADTDAIYKHVAKQVTDGTWIPVKAGRDENGVIVNGAVAEGVKTSASKEGAHAEGSNTVAEGFESHAEGTSTKTSGQGAHAEGWNSHAKGRHAHTEGYRTVAEGSYSHAEGYEVIALGYNTHAEGTYNYYNMTEFIKVLGVGSSNDNRVNAEVVYVKRNTFTGLPDTSDPKNGYKYLLGIGGYTGKDITEGMKSVQEVISDLESRIVTLEAKLKS